jgi:uncharacterized protein YaaQ
MKKMLMAIVPHDRGERVLYELINAGYTATFTETQGGIMRQSQLSLFIAIEEEAMEPVMQIIRTTGVHGTISSENSEGDSEYGAGTIIFVWDLTQTEVY